ncbi:calcium-binding protein [Natrialbaceae archaeon A-gly3]
MDRELSVPLAQLEPIEVDDKTAEAIADWHYWNE